MTTQNRTFQWAGYSDTSHWQSFCCGVITILTTQGKKLSLHKERKKSDSLAKGELLSGWVIKLGFLEMPDRFYNRLPSSL